MFDGGNFDSAPGDGGGCFFNPLAALLVFLWVCFKPVLILLGFFLLWVFKDVFAAAISATLGWPLFLVIAAISLLTNWFDQKHPPQS